MTRPIHNTSGIHDLSPVQEALLDLLRVFIRICEDNQLRYYAWGGTALGAMRHNGFIPWDDDIDIAMPREDFEKLCGKTRTIELPPGYRASESDELLFGTFENCHIKINHGNKAWDERQPFLSIDIFPLDGVPDSPLKRRFHNLYCRALFVAIKLKRINYIKSVESLKNRGSTRPKAERLLIRYGSIVSFLMKPFNESRLVAKYFAAIKKYPYSSSTSAAYYSSRYRAKSIFSKEVIGDGKPVSFEDQRVFAFSEVDEYLKKLFGDSYMIPPPPEMQEKHGDITFA